jgi:hypothetical protein
MTVDVTDDPPLNPHVERIGRVRSQTSHDGGDTDRFAPVIPEDPDPKFTCHRSIALLDMNTSVLGTVCVDPTK